MLYSISGNANNIDAPAKMLEFYLRLNQSRYGSIALRFDIASGTVGWFALDVEPAGNIYMQPSVPKFSGLPLDGRRNAIQLSEQKGTN